MSDDADSSRVRGSDDVAFVLGGGGQRGAHQVGMREALLERRIAPSLIVGTSVGAINGAVIAAQPDLVSARRLVALRAGGGLQGVARTARRDARANADAPAWRRRAARAARRRPAAAHRGSGGALSVCRGKHRAGVGALVRGGAARRCRYGVRRGAGLLPAVEIDGEHYFDGGIVNSIPVARAVELGARTLYVLHVGRLDSPLTPPRWPWEVGLVAFEIARRHRVVGDLARLPGDVTVHVLPTGQIDPPRHNDLRQPRYRDGSQIAERLEQAGYDDEARQARSMRYLSAPRPGRARRGDRLAIRLVEDARRLGRRALRPRGSGATRGPASPRRSPARGVADRQ